MFYNPENHEPLTDELWDEARVRARIPELVAATGEAFDPARLWPSSEEDGGEAGKSLTSLYPGASGVIWAQERLRPHADSGIDLPAAARRTLELWHEQPDSPERHEPPAPDTREPLLRRDRAARRRVVTRPEPGARDRRRTGARHVPGTGLAPCPQDLMEIAPVTPDRWDDFADLFARKGPRGGTPMTAGCWCQWWRGRTGDPAKNRRNMRRIVTAGREPGLLAYEDGVAVGWVSVAPREEYGQLVRSRNYGPREDEEGVWSIVCFYVDPRAKKRGVATALLESAVEHALARGASAVEAYPHCKGDYMGTEEHFVRLGFEHLRRAGTRSIMRYGRRPS